MAEIQQGGSSLSFLQRLVLRKSIDRIQREYESSELKRSLGAVNLVLLGIGCIIGAGIFVRTGNAAALHAGPAVILSYVIAGTVCAFAGLCYAEISSVLPVSGSAYTYSYTTLGEFGAWIMGGLLLLEYGLAASVVAVGWSGYAVSLLQDIGLHIPAHLTQATGKFVIDAATPLSVQDPTVSLSGVIATLSDGRAVQFLTTGAAKLAGHFTATLAPYDVLTRTDAGGFALVNAVDLHLGAASSVQLADAVHAVDPATSAQVALAAGTPITLAAQTVVTLPPDLAVDIPAGAARASLLNLPAVVVVLAMTALLVLGVSESATVNNVIVAIKVVVILAFIGVGVFFIKPENWQPFIPAPTGEPGEFGFSGVLRAASIVFFAYIGFEAVSTAGQESRNPKRDLPVGILGSLVVCTALYMAVSAVLTGVISYTKLNVPAPVATAVDSFGPSWTWLAASIKIGAIAGLTSVILVLMFGQTRIFYTMSRDGLLPSVFGRVHTKFRTPWVNTLVVGGLVACAAALFDINTLGDLTSVGTLMAFAIVCLTALWLRKARPDLPRTFKVPFYPVTPILGILSCLYLITTVEMRVLIFFLWFMIGSIALYFAYGMGHSRLGKGLETDDLEGPPMDLPHPRS
jgi:amino acid transporter